MIPEGPRWKLSNRILPWLVDQCLLVLQGIRNAWREDTEFETAYSRMAPRLLMDRKRAYMLFKLAGQVSSLGGSWAELGVYRGGSAGILSAASRGEKDIYLFDTFAGLPGPDAAHDPYWIAGELRADVTEIIALKLPGVQLVPGQFPGSVGGLRSDVRFSLVHVDVDLAESTRAACEWFYPRMVPGGVLVFDDYGNVLCPGVRESVDEYFANRQEVPIPLPSGQCLVICHGACWASGKNSYNQTSR